MHTKSTPVDVEKPKKAPPKPKLPADLAVDNGSSGNLQSPNPDDIVPTAPSRYTSLKSTSSRGSTPDPDIIPINVPPHEYENTVDYENENVLTSSVEMQRTSPQHGRSTPTTGHNQKPLVPSRGRSETTITSTPEKKPSVTRRDRAETIGDTLSPPPPVKPRSMTVAAIPKKKHDYEEIEDEIGEYLLFVL